jgi:hypothetical protein
MAEETIISLSVVNCGKNVRKDEGAAITVREHFDRGML